MLNNLAKYGGKIMSKEALMTVNEKLIEHFKEVGIENACYYQPVYEDYWANDHKKVAFCNLEPYCVGEAKDTIKGIQVLSEERLYNSWFHKPTTNNTFLLNYVLQQSLKENKSATEETFKKIREEAKKNSVQLHQDMCDCFDQSLYFNCRYTQSPTVNEDKGHTINAYRSDSFYVQHYKEFVKAAEIEVLVLGGREVLEVVTFVYPELQGKLIFCGEPVLYNGVLFVSMLHPAARTNIDAEMASVVNKIAKAIK
ncbi:MAG: hypothetical protein SPL22_12430 [Treponema sp.]|jgi:hypothetical protein|uniref:hypothetical protein n=1 Tax=Treponema sp. TaxID=166 RepID=UPI002A91E741|nr:hypothetical protein [Treponema sp.]MDY6398521.1 hypothetical protein [Treponema sp.]